MLLLLDLNKIYDFFKDSNQHHYILQWNDNFSSVYCWLYFAVMLALKKQGVEEAFVKLLEDICSESTTAVKLHKKGEKIPLMTGVGQGDKILAKLHFYYY